MSTAIRTWAAAHVARARLALGAALFAQAVVGYLLGLVWVECSGRELADGRLLAPVVAVASWFAAYALVRSSHLRLQGGIRLHLGGLALAWCLLGAGALPQPSPRVSAVSHPTSTASAALPLVLAPSRLAMTRAVGPQRRRLRGWLQDGVRRVARSFTPRKRGGDRRSRRVGLELLGVFLIVCSVAVALLAAGLSCSLSCSGAGGGGALLTLTLGGTLAAVLLWLAIRVFERADPSPGCSGRGLDETTEPDPSGLFDAAGRRYPAYARGMPLAEYARQRRENARTDETILALLGLAAVTALTLLVIVPAFPVFTSILVAAAGTSVAVGYGRRRYRPVAEARAHAGEVLRGERAPFPGWKRTARGEVVAATATLDASGSSATEDEAANDPATADASAARLPRPTVPGDVEFWLGLGAVVPVGLVAPTVPLKVAIVLLGLALTALGLWRKRRARRARQPNRVRGGR